MDLNGFFDGLTNLERRTTRALTPRYHLSDASLAAVEEDNEEEPERFKPTLER